MEVKTKMLKILAFVLAMILIVGTLSACSETIPGPTGPQGPKGETGAQGSQGEQGPSGITPQLKVGEDNYWYVSYDNGTTWTNLNVKATGADGAQGPQGEQGESGVNGKDGVGIEKVEFDKNGDLLITFTDGRTQTVTMPENTQHTHTFGSWQIYGPHATNCEDNIYYTVCDDCNEVTFKKGDSDSHVWSNVFSYNAGYHWLDCAECSAVKDYGEHIYNTDSDSLCNICSANRLWYPGEYVLHHIDEELITGGDTTTYNLGDNYFGTVLSEHTIRAGINNSTGNDYIGYNFGNEVFVNCNFVILDDNTAVAYLDSAVDLFNNGNATDVFYFDIVEIDGQPCFVLNATLGSHNYAYYVVKATNCELEEQEYTVHLHNKNGEFVDLETLNFELPNKLWEPGYTEVFYFSITNNTDRDLIYTVLLDIQEVKQNLYEVVDYVLIPDVRYGEISSLNAYNLTTLKNGINDININDIVISSGATHYYAIAFRMQVTAGNSYMNGDFKPFLDITVNKP